MNRPLTIARTLLALSLAGLLSACAGKPAPLIATDPPSLPQDFHFSPDDTVAGSLADLLPRGDPAYEKLSAIAIAEAPSLAEAIARIEAARGRAERAGSERLPSVDADASITRQRINPNQFGEAGASGLIPRDQTIYGANVAARWDPDIFGQLQAQERAALARIDAAGAQAAAVRNSLIAEIAVAVIDWRTLAARAAALREDVAAAAELVRLAGVRERAGIAPGFDRVRAEAQASASRSRLSALESERARIVGRLVTLTGANGQVVANALGEPFGLIEPGPPPAALPSELLVNRPDVMAAAAELAATDQDLAATARSRFPRFTLSAVIGLLAFDPGDLFDTDSIVGTLAGSVAGPILDFGRIDAEIDVAAANKRAAFQAYRGAVFQALGDAETGYGLIAAADAEAQLALTERRELERAARLADTRFRAGLSNFLEVLEARRAADASGDRAAAAAGRANRARVILWQALGGSQPSAVIAIDAQNGSIPPPEDPDVEYQ